MILPPIDEGTYLLELWQDAGSVDSSGMGITRLSWNEINNWLEVRNKMQYLNLKHWEIELVRRLSEEYSGQYGISSERDCPPPYEIATVEDLDRAALVNKAKNVLAGFKKQKQEPKYETVEKE